LWLERAVRSPVIRPEAWHMERRSAIEYSGLEHGHRRCVALARMQQVVAPGAPTKS